MVGLIKKDENRWGNSKKTMEFEKGKDRIVNLIEQVVGVGPWYVHRQ